VTPDGMLEQSSVNKVGGAFFSKAETEVTNLDTVGDSD
jgi:hypothetical protein